MGCEGRQKAPDLEANGLAKGLESLHLRLMGSVAVEMMVDGRLCLGRRRD